MTVSNLLMLVFLGLFAWYWQATLKAREIGIATARRLCAEEGLQFLDDTVVPCGIRIRRGTDGKPHLQRSFIFEYSLSGAERLRGTVSLLGNEISILDLRLPPEAIPPQLH